MRPSIASMSWKGLQVFSDKSSDRQFVWDPERVALAEIPTWESAEVQAEVLTWSQESNESRWNSQNQVRTITINVTQVCNLKCLYCAAGGDGTYGQAQKRADIDRVVPQLKNILNSLKPGSSLRITFSGGEPLLYPEGIRLVCEQALDQAKTLGVTVYFGIVTNGTLLTASNLELLSRFKMDLTVSLDGNPLQNRVQRPTSGGGDPTALIEKGLTLMKNYKSQLGALIVSGVFNKYNQDILGAYQYYAQWDFDLFDFNFDYFEKDPEASESFSQSMTLLASQIFQSEGLGGLKKILFFKRVFEQLDSGIKLSHHCGAGQSYVAMDAKGDLYACPWKIGSLEFKVETPSQEFLYQSTNRPDCSRCWARPLCGGGCQFQHDSLEKEQIELFCQRMKSLLQTAFLFYIQGRDDEHYDKTS